VAAAVHHIYHIIRELVHDVYIIATATIVYTVHEYTKVSIYRPSFISYQWHMRPASLVAGNIRSSRSSVDTIIGRCNKKKTLCHQSIATVHNITLTPPISLPY